MNCCNDRPEVDIKLHKKGKEIEESLKKARKRAETRVKLLLLGTGDSGKSTFVKQMKVIHKDGFSNAEIAKFQIVLQENCLNSMQRILQCENVKIAKKLKGARERVLASSVLKDCVKDLVALWEDKGLKDGFERRCDLSIQVPSTTPYFFENAYRFAEDGFRPIPDDIFRAKLKTTGISEVTFELGGIDFTIVDVGGQRSERRKWLHCFDDVTSVIYLAALDEYDMKLEEDNQTNRLDESLRLFGEVSASHFFQPTSWILFLNKSDLFAEKIKKRPLHEYFPDFPESDSYGKPDEVFDKAWKFMQRKYEDNFKGSRLYPYVTCAIDTTNCKRVFTAVRDTVITAALNDAGF